MLNEMLQWRRQWLALEMLSQNPWHYQWLAVCLISDVCEEVPLEMLIQNQNLMLWRHQWLASCLLSDPWVKIPVTGWPLSAFWEFPMCFLSDLPC